MYDSFPATKGRDKDEWQLLVQHTVKFLLSTVPFSMPFQTHPSMTRVFLQRTAIVLVLLQTDMYADVMTWEIVDVDCPTQTKYVFALL